MQEHEGDLESDASQVRKPGRKFGDIACIAACVAASAECRNRVITSLYNNSISPLPWNDTRTNSSLPFCTLSRLLRLVLRLSRSFHHILQLNVDEPRHSHESAISSVAH